MTARLDGGATSKSRHPPSLTAYGLKGTLVLAGGNDMSPRELHHYDYARDSWNELIIPPSDPGSGPSTDLVQQDWNLLAHRFVADITGDGDDYYPTFEDGWMASAIIGMVRGTQGGAAVPASPGS